MNTKIDDPLTRLTGVAKKPTDFPAMLTAWLPEIKRALPKHLNADRMSRIALTAFRRTPKLANCDPRSVFAAVIQAAQLGLEPDTLGRSYLIPYGTECQFVPGWKGLVDLMNRSGQGTVWTGVIFRDQRYNFVDGSRRELEILNETELADPTDITHAYAIGWVTGAKMPLVELWRTEKLKKHRDRYNKVGQKHYSFQNWEMYARKIPLLQVLKYMPCSPELATAMALNDAAEMGRQKIDLNDAIEGSWAPVPEDEDTNVGQGAAAASKDPKEPKRTTAKDGTPTDSAPAPTPETQGNPAEGGTAPAAETPTRVPTVPLHLFAENNTAIGQSMVRANIEVGQTVTYGNDGFSVLKLMDTPAGRFAVVRFVAQTAAPAQEVAPGRPVGEAVDAGEPDGPQAPKPRGRRKAVDFGGEE